MKKAKTIEKQAHSAALRAMAKHRAKPPKRVIDVPGSRRLAKALEGYNDILGTITRIALDTAFAAAQKALRAEQRKLARSK